MLRQIRVRYDPLEDRLLLTLDVDERVYHLLLTRRVWARARQALQQLLDLSAQAPVGLPATLRSSLSAANHHAMAALTPAAREPVAEHGAPSGAVLVTGIRFGERKPHAGTTARHAWILQFDLHGQPGLRLAVNDKTLHALVGALLQREESARWVLPALPACTAPVLERPQRLQ